jgi:hypothetical protein
VKREVLQKKFGSTKERWIIMSLMKAKEWLGLALLLVLLALVWTPASATAKIGDGEKAKQFILSGNDTIKGSNSIPPENTLSSDRTISIGLPPRNVQSPDGTPSRGQ